MSGVLTKNFVISFVEHVGSGVQTTVSKMIASSKRKAQAASGMFSTKPWKPYFDICAKSMEGFWAGPFSEMVDEIASRHADIVQEFIKCYVYYIMFNFSKDEKNHKLNVKLTNNPGSGEYHTFLHAFLLQVIGRIVQDPELYISNPQNRDYINGQAFNEAMFQLATKTLRKSGKNTMQTAAMPNYRESYERQVAITGLPLEPDLPIPPEPAPPAMPAAPVPPQMPAMPPALVSAAPAPVPPQMPVPPALPPPPQMPAGSIPPAPGPPMPAPGPPQMPVAPGPSGPPMYPAAAVPAGPAATGPVAAAPPMLNPGSHRSTTRVFYPNTQVYMEDDGEGEDGEGEDGITFDSAF